MSGFPIPITPPPPIPIAVSFHHQGFVSKAHMLFFAFCFIAFTNFYVQVPVHFSVLQTGWPVGLGLKLVNILPFFFFFVSGLVKTGLT